MKIHLFFQRVRQRINFQEVTKYEVTFCWRLFAVFHACRSIVVGKAGRDRTKEHQQAVGVQLPEDMEDNLQMMRVNCVI